VVPVPSGKRLFKILDFCGFIVLHIQIVVDCACFGGGDARNQKDKATSIAIIGISFFPVLLTLIAWDTTRVAGFGWLGLMIALGVLMREWNRRPKVYRYGFVGIDNRQSHHPVIQRGIGF
jgi:hypothetical protein